eukprot:616561-Rhodomonas_salina.1
MTRSKASLADFALPWSGNMPVNWPLVSRRCHSCPDCAILKSSELGAAFGKWRRAPQSSYSIVKTWNVPGYPGRTWVPGYPGTGGFPGYCGNTKYPGFIIPGNVPQVF